MDLDDHPISNIEWVHVNDLAANDYNPNVCGGLEFDLLKLSLIKQGWIQPVLVCQRNKIIIDGFHRYSLTKSVPEVYEATGGKIPVAYLDLTEPERKMLTVRINRAKGVHVAFRMHELVASLVADHGMAIEEVAQGIGATPDEINTLLMEDIFEKKDVANTDYSKAWGVKKKVGRGANANA